MDSAGSNSALRIVYTVHASDAEAIVCHRTRQNVEQFLLRWKKLAKDGLSPIFSWHALPDLEQCMHLVQEYAETLQHHLIQPGQASQDLEPNSSSLQVLPPNRKRKSHEIDTVSREHSHGLLTPGSSLRSRTSSPASINFSSVSLDERNVYNGILYHKAGRIVARRPRDPCALLASDPVALPTHEMIEAASQTALPGVVKAIRKAFLVKLRRVKNVRLENKIDLTTPPLNFIFIDEYKLREGVYQTPAETFEGCQRCRPNMGQNVGCEYTQKCDCLEYATVDESRLQATNPEMYATYRAMRAAGNQIDTQGLPKRFPYTKPVQDTTIPQTLVSWYREERHPIYECNDNCRCGPRCKNRLVQKGRKVPLTIFKTKNRGWGVYCNEDLIAGEFVDTYLGEVITSSEADRREEHSGQEKNSYLYSLDKFVGDTDTLTPESCYVVDGQYMGGPTRFINHSCEPNCRQYTVSFNKHDNRLYNLVFFAFIDIPAKTELTFDYMDQDDVEEEDAIRLREEALRDPKNKDKVRCGCGAAKCRGYLWERTGENKDE